MLSFLETPGDIKRFLEIMRVFLKYGWEGAFEVKKMKERFPFISRLEASAIGGANIPHPVKLRIIFEELGPTFIKFGQMLSTRPDLIKEEYIVELKKLLDEAPGFDFVEVKQIIQKEFGRPIDSIYKKFERTPVAAASLGQVHFAELKTGQKVAVKIQRPDIQHTIAEDMRIIGFIAGLVEKNIKSTQYYNPTSVAQEFSDTIKKELDYNLEAKNAERFSHNFRNDSKVLIPKIYWKYTGKKVITLARVKGKKISAFYSSKDKALKRRISNSYIDCFFRQMLLHGFFQADPHPANIFVHIQGGRPIISLVDFGMVGRLDQEMRDGFAAIMMLVVDRNVKALTKQLQSMKLVPRLDDERAFKLELSELIDYFYEVETDRVDVAGFGNGLINLMVKYKIKIPKHYVLFLRSIGIAQDTVQRLYPEIDLIENAKPYIEMIIKEKTKPEYMLRAAKENYFDMQRFLKEFPESIMRIFKKMEEEDFKISVEAETLDELGKSLSKSSSTMSISIIVAALILASALMMNTQIQTAIGNTVDIGAVGFVGAMVIGMLIVLKILNA